MATKTQEAPKKAASTQKQEAAASTKLVTGMVRFSYAHVFSPAAAEGSEEKKYSVSIIIPKDDTVTLKKIKRAIEAAKEAGKTKKFGGKIPANLKSPLRDGDEERPDDEPYANCFFINATSNTKPGIVDKNCDPILEQDEFYSGCYGRASLNFFAYNAAGNKGIGAGLQHVQKLKDGEPLGGGRGKAEDDFNDGFEFDEDDDLLGDEDDE